MFIRLESGEQHFLTLADMQADELTNRYIHTNGVTIFHFISFLSLIYLRDYFKSPLGRDNGHPCVGGDAASCGPTYFYGQLGRPRGRVVA